MKRVQNTDMDSANVPLSGIRKIWLNVMVRAKEKPQLNWGEVQVWR